MTTSFLPDLNVWLAQVNPLHPHFASSSHWFDSVPVTAAIVLCRTTQAGLLRLLTTRAVMGKLVMTQREAWGMLDKLMLGENITYLPEPGSCWDVFRDRTWRSESSPKHWADAYLAAFALTASLQLVTFDRALAGTVPGSILLTE